MLKSGLIMMGILVGFYGNSQQAQLFEPGLISDGGVFGLTISPKGNTTL